MRITHLYKNYLPHPGGVERAMHVLGAAMASEGHHVRAIVASGGRRATRRTVDGVDVVGVPTFGEVWSVPFSPALLLVPPLDGEILHVHESFPLATVAALIRVRRRERSRVVVTWHFDVLRQRALAPFHHALAALLLARAEVIHVTSDLLAARSPSLRRFRGKVRVIPHMIDVARFAQVPSHPLARRIRAWADGGPVALFVGRLVYYKGLDVALEAIAAVPKVRFVLVGDGPLRARLEAQARSLGLTPRAMWLGQLSDADLVGAYSGADVLVLPSTAPTETFGVVQLEAMAAGLPVISTRLGTGVERVNIDGVTGRVVTPGSASELSAALAEVVGSERRRSFAEAAVARAQEFRPECLSSVYLDMYGTVRA